MPRPARIEFPGATYFIAAQALPDQPLFKDDIDRRRFLEIIDNAVRRYGLLLHAFTILNDGYRLLVETPNSNLTKAMQYINSHYTAYVNTRRNSNKQLFKGRYLSTVIEKERYLLKLTRYIHLLPLEKGIADQPSSYPWSSYSQYVLPNDQPPSVYTKDVSWYFEGSQQRIRNRFKQIVDSGIGFDMSATTILLKKTRILGSAKFSETMKDNSSDIVPDKTDPKLIIDECAKFYNVDAITVVDNHTKPNPSRNAAIFLCRNMTDIPLEKLGEMFGVGPSSICNTAKRVEANRRSEEELAKALKQIESNIRKQ